jgi:hypothetical protein
LSARWRLVNLKKSNFMQHYYSPAEDSQNHIEQPIFPQKIKGQRRSFARCCVSIKSEYLVFYK